MTNVQMKYEFDVLYDKITSSGAPGYTDKEVSVFLSKGEKVLFDSCFDTGKSFEETEQRRKFFSNLKRAVNPTVSTSQTGVHPNGVFYDLPTDYGYTSKEEVTTASSDTCKNNQRIRVKPITEAEYTININNPHKKPYCQNEEGLVWRMDFNTERHELITASDFTVANYHLRYWKHPTGITVYTNDGTTTAGVDSELNEQAHRYIIETAVRIATGITNPQEYQIKLNEEKTNI